MQFKKRLFKASGVGILLHATRLFLDTVESKFLQDTGDMSASFICSLLVKESN